MEFPARSSALMAGASTTRLPDNLHDTFSMIAVYPNPVPATGSTIAIHAPVHGTIGLHIYNVRGEKVWLHEERKDYAGNWEFYWDLNNPSRNGVSYGSYYLLATLTNERGYMAKASKWIGVLK